ncbi:MAG: VCBS repeat-containing protein, partial [Bacteroidetes bacterium]
MKQIALLLPFALGWSLACAQPAFVDLATQAGIAATGQNYGIAIADYDGDGYDDLYVTRRDGPNLLYHNLGNLQFEEVAGVAGVANAGVSSCAVWGDFDNDGWPDLLVTDRDADNVLYHNNGDGTFTDITAQAGVAEGSKVRAALTADVNGDGWLDIYLARLGLENKLYLNNGDGTFTDYTAASGALDDQISMGAVFFDYDNDGDPDLYLTHDAHQPYILYQNDGTGHFTDVSAAAGVNYAGQGMGVCTGDINHDGWLDIYITNLSFNTLYLNNGDGTFTDISDAAGVTDPGMGWGCTFLDCDNDTWPDIYMANDSYFSPLPNVLYRNRGDLTFENISEGTPLASMFAGYAVAVADFDHNG